MYTLTGALKVKNQEQQVSEKFKKREFVVSDTSSQYPQHISFQLTQDKCSLLEPYKIGDVLKVYFNLRGREWTSPQGELKYFNSLEAWKIEGNTSNASVNESAAAETTFTATAEDDLPF